MRFASFRHKDRDAAGVLADPSHVLDLRALGEPRYATLLDFIRGGAEALAHAEAALAAKASHAQWLHPLDAVRLQAPIPRPQKNVFCVGRNYLAHVEEGARARGQAINLPKAPQFFTKPPTAVIGPDAEIRLDPKVTQQLDYEVELGVVIGEGGRDIRAQDAMRHVFGYTIVNDVTARDLQRLHEQWFKGKGLDTSCPMGPALVHKAEIADVNALALKLSVNGEQRQSARVAQMIFDIPTIIAELSKGMTLEAGDIIATGTPEGVGFAMTPPRFLKGGDVVVCEIAGLGTLSNRVVEA